MIGQLSRAEKAQVLPWVAQDLEDAFLGTEKIEGVSGGAACIVRTRIPVWSLVQAKRMRVHADEIDQAIFENESD